MSVRSISNASKPVTLGAYFFRMYQMVTEQERLICQKEALWNRQKTLQSQVNHLEKEIQQLEQQLIRKREVLKKRNYKSAVAGGINYGKT